MKLILKIIGALIVLMVIGFILIQLVPYGRDHANPPVVSEPKWDSPRTKELAQIACFDCHSNQTVWPWYSNIAPGSWLIYHDVEDGRSRLNFSDLGSSSRGLDEVTEMILSGEMPPPQYLLIHRNANLTTAEREELSKGMQATFGQ